MFSIAAVGIISVTAVLIALADAIIKKIAISNTFIGPILSPGMLLICALYFAQILLALYVFMQKGDLAIYGILFIVFYALCMVTFGVLFFNEHLTYVQGIGIVLALAGALLLNTQ